MVLSGSKPSATSFSTAPKIPINVFLQSAWTVKQTSESQRRRNRFEIFHQGASDSHFLVPKANRPNQRLQRKDHESTSRP